MRRTTIDSFVSRYPGQLSTDGEFRRSWYQFDFMKELDGELYRVGEGIAFHGVRTRAEPDRHQ
jgi:methionine synthase II (cobalamin-independent)